MFDFLEATFYVEVLIFVQKLIHCSVGTGTWLIVSKVLEVFGGDARDQILNICIWSKTWAQLIESAFDRADILVNWLNLITRLTAQDTSFQNFDGLVLIRILVIHMNLTHCFKLASIRLRTIVRARWTLTSPLATDLLIQASSKESCACSTRKSWWSRLLWSCANLIPLGANFSSWARNTITCTLISDESLIWSGMHV